MAKASDKSGRRLIIAGVVLIFCATVFFGYNIWDDIRAGKSSASVAGAICDASGGKMDDYRLFPDMEMPLKEIDGVSYVGKLQIPSLGLELPVISEVSSRSLRIAPCRYTGSAYNDTLVIAAHNYSSHFGRIKELQQDDEVIFTDVKDNTFVYRVTELEVLKPGEVEKMIKSDADLTLFTCTIGGASRVTLRCNRISE